MLRIVVATILLLLPAIGFSFPDLTRHGYGNCTTCHVSPTGGGVLTTYGRELSREVLAMQSGEKEPYPFHGALDLPKWLKLGGDARFLQLYRNTPTVKEGRFFLMQADVEAAVGSPQLMAVVSTGVVEESKNEYESETRRYYVMGEVAPQVYVRAGKFMHSFGLNVPDHVIVTKRGLGWDEGSETHNIEATYLGEQLNLSFTAVFGKPDDKAADREQGGVAQISYFFANQYKIGMSLFTGSNDSLTRQIGGIWGILGLTKQFFILTEWDALTAKPKGGSAATGFVSYNKFGYELWQGLQLHLTQELSKADIDDEKFSLLATGLGFQVVPRPHFIIGGLWQKQQRPLISQQWSDFAWLQLQYYL